MMGKGFKEATLARNYKCNLLETKSFLTIVSADCTFPYFFQFTSFFMGMNSSLRRLLVEPDALHREIIETDLVEKDDVVEGNATPSFLNTLAGDLDTKVVAIHKNTNQRLIIVTQDKTLLTLKRNIAKLGTREWIAPLSTLSTILIALITSNFRYAMGLGASEWRAIFIVCGFVSFGWLVNSIYRSLGCKTFHQVICDICFELGARPKMAPEPVPVRTARKSISASATIAACKIRFGKKSFRKPKKKSLNKVSDASD